ncbi:MAG: hypothetical protein H0V50_02790 [Thermoleophilaceae bacterium]|nr:hypothetical protein [Thermoleophilaceae bacterium]
MTTRNAGEIALAIQASRGTAATVSTQRAYTMAGRLASDFEISPSPELRTTRMGGRPWAGATPGLGDVTVAVRPKMIGLLLYAALGAKSVSGAGDPYTHVFTPATTVPWLTAWSHFGEILDERFVNVRVGRLTISSSARGIVTASVTLLAGSPAYRTARETTVIAEEADTLFHRHGASALLLEGVAFTSISAWTLTIDTGVALEQSLAGPLPRMNGLMTISLEITHRISDAALWKRAIYGSASPANLAAPQALPLALGGSPVGAEFTLTASASRSLKIALPQLALSPSEGMAGVPAFGPVIVSTRLLAYLPASGAGITATVKNAQASY